MAKPPANPTKSRHFRAKCQNHLSQMATTPRPHRCAKRCGRGARVRDSWERWPRRRKGIAGVGGRASPCRREGSARLSAQFLTPNFPQPNRMNESILSDQIKAEAEQESGEAIDSPRRRMGIAEVGGRASQSAIRSRAERDRLPKAARRVRAAARINPQFRRSDPPSLGYGVASQIKAEAKSQSRACGTEEAEQESGEATRRSDPPSLRFGVASQIKANLVIRVEFHA